jgi:hypothetical protein
MRIQIGAKIHMPGHFGIARREEVEMVGVSVSFQAAEVAPAPPPPRSTVSQCRAPASQATRPGGAARRFQPRLRPGSPPKRRSRPRDRPRARPAHPPGRATRGHWLQSPPARPAAAPAHPDTRHRRAEAKQRSLAHGRASPHATRFRSSRFTLTPSTHSPGPRTPAWPHRWTCP